MEKGGCSQNVKATCGTYAKGHYVECLYGIKSCFGCGKEWHNVRDCPDISSRWRKGKQDAASAPKDDVQKTKARFYALRTREEKPNESDDDVGNSFYLFLDIWVPSMWGVWLVDGIECPRSMLHCAWCLGVFFEIEFH